MRISDWSSYVCSSDLDRHQAHRSTFKIDALILGHVLHIVQRIFDEARNRAMIARRADDDPIGTAQCIDQRSGLLLSLFDIWRILLLVYRFSFLHIVFRSLLLALFLLLPLFHFRFTFSFSLPALSSSFCFFFSSFFFFLSFFL